MKYLSLKFLILVAFSTLFQTAYGQLNVSNKNPEVFIGSINPNDSFSVADILAQDSIIGFKDQRPLHVTSYHIITISKDSYPTVYFAKSNKLNETVRTMISELEVGSKILIESVKAESINQTEIEKVNLKPSLFIVKLP